MRLKKGSKWGKIAPEILLAVMVAKSVFEDHGYELILTEGTGGEHMEASLHYYGQAIDIRTRHVPEELRHELSDDLRRRLTDDYDVVLEATHIHCEHDPK